VRKTLTSKATEAPNEYHLAREITQKNQVTARWPRAAVLPEDLYARFL